jgi:mono/diheme cytochrome c family protein
MMRALPAESAERKEDAPEPSAATSAIQGADLYAQHCATCHGAQGEGLGSFPPLAGSSWVTGEEDTAIRILLHGLQGPIEVNGRSYSNVMPAFGRRLTDAEIAELLSYLRTSWDHDTEAVEPAQVREVRAEHSGRSQPWTASELRESE